jgi:hypothetical protein
LWRFGVAKLVKGEGRKSNVIPIALLIMSAAACHAPTEKKREPEVAWRRLGAWSGSGSTQTESFLFESGALRVRWETRNEESGHVGQFRLTLHSAVSGREMAVAAEQRGVGKGESLIAETPHQAYLLVESSFLDWTFSIDEGTVSADNKAP